MIKPKISHSHYQYKRLTKMVASAFLSLILSLFLAIAMAAAIIGASIQYQDRSAALAAMEVSE